MSVNKHVILGNCGNDPEVRSFDNGNKVANFSVATSESYTNKEGVKVENTTWHNIAVFGKLAEVVEKWVKKGQALYIEGKVITRSYEDKDGNKRYSTETVIKDFNDVLQMLGKKDSNTEEPAF